MSDFVSADTALPAELSHVIAEAEAPRHGDQTPSEWVRNNLFNNWYNAIITVVFSLLALYLGYRAALFVFVNGEWSPVRANLELFMIGRFPRDERTRMVVNIIVMMGSLGLAMGWVRASARDRAELAGTELTRSTPRELLSSYWALGLFTVSLFAVGVRTAGPWLILAACAAAALIGFQLAVRAPSVLRAASLSASLLGGVIAFQALSGTGGLAWCFQLLALTPALLDLTGRWAERLPTAAGAAGTVVTGLGAALVLSERGFGPSFVIVAGAAAAGTVSAILGRRLGLSLGVLTVVGVVCWQISDAIGHENVDWVEWGGLYMNLLAAAAAIVLAFPLGLLLALGRRSGLPAVRWLSTIYIEIIRGVPLITLLLMARFFLGFFVDSDTPPSLPTRAIAAITLFSAAYIAEIVRGGLQAVPIGQTEAGQALGLAPAGITRLLVLPQALRAVIPAMVGQFISLFKDTSLLIIIAVLEFVGVRDVVHAQSEFLPPFAIAETLVFIAFGFWAFSFTMSRESQRLERKLGIGVR